VFDGLITVRRLANAASPFIRDDYHFPQKVALCGLSFCRTERGSAPTSSYLFMRCQLLT